MYIYLYIKKGRGGATEIRFPISIPHVETVDSGRVGERLQYRSPILPSSAVPHDKHSDLCILHARAGMLDSSKDSGKKADGARWNLCNCLYIVFHAICV